MRGARPTGVRWCTSHHHASLHLLCIRAVIHGVCPPHRPRATGPPYWCALAGFPSYTGRSGSFCSVLFFKTPSHRLWLLKPHPLARPSPGPSCLSHSKPGRRRTLRRRPTRRARGKEDGAASRQEPSVPGRRDRNSPGTLLLQSGVRAAGARGKKLQTVVGPSL